MGDSAALRVTVMYSAQPRQVLEWQVVVPAGSTALHAMEASGLAQVLAPQQWLAAGIGIWGRKCPLEQPVREGDRIEVYRPLQVDPKVARRERFRRQGTRAAGLFARKHDAGPPG